MNIDLLKTLSKHAISPSLLSFILIHSLNSNDTFQKTNNEISSYLYKIVNIYEYFIMLLIIGQTDRYSLPWYKKILQVF